MKVERHEKFDIGLWQASKLVLVFWGEKFYKIAYLDGLELSEVLQCLRNAGDGRLEVGLNKRESRHLAGSTAV